VVLALAAPTSFAAPAAPVLPGAFAVVGLYRPVNLFTCPMCDMFYKERSVRFRHLARSCWC